MQNAEDGILALCDPREVTSLGVLIPGFPGDPQVPFSPEQWRVLSPWRPSFPSDANMAGRVSLSLQEGLRWVVGWLLPASALRRRVRIFAKVKSLMGGSWVCGQ